MPDHTSEFNPITVFLAEHRRSGYAKKAASERRARRKALGIGQGGSFA